MRNVNGNAGPIFACFVFAVTIKIYGMVECMNRNILEVFGGIRLLGL